MRKLCFKNKGISIFIGCLCPCRNPCASSRPILGTTHESSVQFSGTDIEAHPTRTKENSFKVQPNYPDTEFRYTNAYYRDRIMDMDKQVGEVVEALRTDGLLENTFIFYYGDHGGVLPGSKGTDSISIKVRESLATLLGLDRM